jgi:hypothetical protein
MIDHWLCDGSPQTQPSLPQTKYSHACPALKHEAARRTDRRPRKQVLILAGRIMSVAAATDN